MFAFSISFCIYDKVSNNNAIHRNYRIPCNKRPPSSDFLKTLVCLTMVKNKFVHSLALLIKIKEGKFPINKTGVCVEKQSTSAFEDSFYIQNLIFEGARLCFVYAVTNLDKEMKIILFRLSSQSEIALKAPLSND